MNELINVKFDGDNPTVSGRELHEFLEVETRYNDWFVRMCEYGFSEGNDFYSKKSKTTNGGRPSTDHCMTIAMAKEICMIQRSEKGKIARQYFLKLEEAWNTPEMVMSRALKMAEKKMNHLTLVNTELKEEIEKQKPKVLFADAVEAAHTTILIGDLAKLIKQNGVDIGQNRLFTWLRDNGYLIRRKGDSFNMPTQKSMELGLFEVKERTINNPDGSIRITKTTKVTGKGQQYFINQFLQKEMRAKENTSVSVGAAGV